MLGVVFLNGKEYRTSYKPLGIYICTHVEDGSLKKAFVSFHLLGNNCLINLLEVRNGKLILTLCFLQR